MQDRYQVRSVTRALDLLLAFRDHEGPYELTLLSRRVGLHPTTAFRYLESLRSRGIVRVAPDGGYELGSPVFELASAYLRRLSIWDQAPGLAQRVAQASNETASVGVVDSGEVLYIAIVNGQAELGIQSRPGTRHPVHATALGKAMLADLAWPEVESIVRDHPLIGLTERTITTAEALRDQLCQIRDWGYAVDDEERTSGVVCIGAPIRDHTGRTIAAVSISGPRFRIDAHGREAVARLVIDAATEASLRLGAPRDTLPALAAGSVPSARA